MKNRITVEVSGGLVSWVAADEDVEIIILDYDNLKEASLDELRQMGPIPTAPATLDVDRMIEEYEIRRAECIAKLEELNGRE